MKNVFLSDGEKKRYQPESLDKEERNHGSLLKRTTDRTNTQPERAVFWIRLPRTQSQSLCVVKLGGMTERTVCDW
ncbi:MAG: hypothetical protein ACYDAM_00085 [Leptospirales bacterium]